MTKRCGLSFRAFVLALAAALGISTAAAPSASAYTIYPGDAVEIQYSNGLYSTCTVASFAYRDGAMYAITAGHCFLPAGGARPVRVLGADARTVVAGDLRDSGFEYAGGAKLTAPTRDIGWFRVDSHVTNGGATRGGHVKIPLFARDNAISRSSQAIYPNRPVAGRLPVTAVRPGQIVCKDGATTSRTCGPVLHVNPASGGFTALMIAGHGDSGAPVYVLGRDRRAYLVGVLSAGAFGLLTVVDGIGTLPAGLR